MPLLPLRIRPQLLSPMLTQHIKEEPRFGPQRGAGLWERIARILPFNTRPKDCGARSQPTRFSKGVQALGRYAHWDVHAIHASHGTCAADTPQVTRLKIRVGSRLEMVVT